jgi:hypothetical protein
VIAIRRGPLALLERIALAAASMLVSINVCTGFPLLVLWVGSRAANGNIFSWIGIITAIVSLAGLAALGVVALTRLSARYNKVTGRPPPTRQPRPWELSMSAARVGPGRARRDTNPALVRRCGRHVARGRGRTMAFYSAMRCMNRQRWTPPP